MATKRCSYCGEVKDESEFPKASRNKDGLSYWCKDCYSKRAGHKRHKKSEYMPETKKCITCGLVKTRAEFSLHGTSCSGLKGECIECEKDRQLKRVYGITLVDYKIMFENQNGLCAICKQPEIIKTKSLAVDHDHKTGRVRSLLCNNYNKKLGDFQDDIKILESAISYLRKHQ